MLRRVKHFFRVVLGVEVRAAREALIQGQSNYIESLQELNEILENQVQIYKELRKLEVGK